MRNTGDGVPFEVIIVLNGSAEEVAEFVKESVRGARIVQSGVNRGVAGGYNLGRAAARGEFIIVLHDDVEVRSGWLDALVRAADETREAGAVGGCALNPDGTLQATGAIIRQDGTTDVLREESSERRVVDYSGSYCLLVRSEMWDAVGGLDERFFPAYYVDVDLAMKIRAAGGLVLYEPAAQVTHRRGGATPNQGLRHFVAERNRQRFLEKWHLGTLSEEPPSSELDYLRLDLAVKNAYIAEVEQRLERIERSRGFRLAERLLLFARLVSRLATSSRKGSHSSVDRSGTYRDSHGHSGGSGSS